MGNFPFIWRSPPLADFQKRIQSLFGDDYRSTYPLADVRPGLICTLVKDQVKVFQDASAFNFPEVTFQVVDDVAENLVIARDVELKFSPANCEVKAGLPFPRSPNTTVKVEIQVTADDAYLCSSPEVVESQIPKPLELINELQQIDKFNEFLLQYRQKYGKGTRFYLITHVLHCRNGIYYVSTGTKGSGTASGAVTISQVAEGQFSFGLEAGISSGITITPSFCFGLKMTEIFPQLPSQPKKGRKGSAAVKPQQSMATPNRGAKGEDEKAADLRAAANGLSRTSFKKLQKQVANHPLEPPASSTSELAEAQVLSTLPKSSATKAEDEEESSSG